MKRKMDESSDSEEAIPVSSDSDEAIPVSSDSEEAIPISSDSDEAIPISSDSDEAISVSSDSDEVISEQYEFPILQVQNIRKLSLKWSPSEKRLISPLTWINENVWGWKINADGHTAHTGYERKSNTNVAKGIRGFRAAQNYTDPLMRLLHYYPIVYHDIADIPLRASMHDILAQEEMIQHMKGTVSFHKEFIEEPGVEGALSELAHHQLHKRSSLPMVISVLSARSILLLATNQIIEASKVWYEFEKKY